MCSLNKSQEVFVMKKSAIVSLASLMAAFLTAEGIKDIGGNPQYLTQNQTQIDFINYFKTHKNDIVALKEIKSLATKHYAELKNFLIQNKFDASQLRPFSKDTIGIASLLEIISPWECTPGIVELSQNASSYRAICFNSDCLDIRNLRHTNRHEPIFKIPLRNGDWVVISVEHFPRAIMDINSQFIELVEKSETDKHPKYKGIILPYLSINYNCDMSWLLKLEIKGVDPTPFFVSQAIHQNILSLNHEGIMARSASVVSLTRNFVYDTSGYYKVDHPFLLAVVRPQVKTPLFVGYFMPDSWVKK